MEPRPQNVYGQKDQDGSCNDAVGALIMAMILTFFKTLPFELARWHILALIHWAGFQYGHFSFPPVGLEMSNMICEVCHGLIIISFAKM